MASFDSNGLVIDRLADIKAAIQADLRSVYGDGINLSETSPFGVLVGVLSERYYLLWEKLEAIYEASFPNTAFGVYLDELSAFNGITRDAATSSVVDLTFTRSNGINDGDVVVPSGTKVTSGGASSISWVTEADLTILDGSMTGTTQAKASETGPIGALAGTLTNMISVPTNVASVTNSADAVEGRNEETDSEYKLRRQLQLGRSGTATEPGIRSALINMDEVETASVITNDTDLDDVDGRPPHSFEAYVLLEAGFELGMTGTLVYDADFVVDNFVQVTINAVGSGAPWQGDQVSTLAAVASVLEGYDEVYSATSDGVRTITIRGSLPEDFVVSSLVTGGASQAVATWTQIQEADVVTMNAIGQKIWNSKAAGIQSYGAFTSNVVDSAGADHTVYYSEIVAIRIYTQITLTTNSDYDAATAEPAIKAAIVEWASLNLSPGQDVFTYKVLCAASDVDAAGIESIVVQLSEVSDSGPWEAVKIEVGTNEVATIDSSDIVFA